jgi:hypothetical protein
VEVEGPGPVFPHLFVVRRRQTPGMLVIGMASRAAKKGVADLFEVTPD